MMRNFYPNPFRSGNLDNTINQTEIFEEVKETLEPFLCETLEPFLLRFITTDKFYLLHHFIDEFGNLKFQLRIVRLLQRKVLELYPVLEQKFTQKLLLKPIGLAIKLVYKIISRQLKKQLNTNPFYRYNNYNQNLRYLEWPLHPVTDRIGFEIQDLSEDFIENTIEEIYEGYAFVYDYCPKMFPESIALWRNYALFGCEPGEFSFISHDSLLHSTYLAFQRLYYDLRKNSFNSVNWVILGDLNTNLLKIITPRIEVVISPPFVWAVLESLFTLTILVVIVKYIILHYKAFLALKEPIGAIVEEIGIPREITNIKTFLSDSNLDIHYYSSILLQKSKRFKAKIIDLKYNIKYTIVKKIVATVAI